MSSFKEPVYPQGESMNERLILRALANLLAGQAVERVIVSGVEIPLGVKEDIMNVKRSSVKLIAEIGDILDKEPVSPGETQ